MFDTLGQEIAEVERALSDLVGRLDPDAVPAGEAAALYTRFDRIARAATAARTLLARCVEASLDWQRHGHRTAAEHLAAATGSTLGAARAELETSRALPSLPTTAEALRCGALSPAQGVVIADAARVNPGAEADLVAVARRTNLRELAAEAGRAKAAADPDPEATHARIREARRCTRFTDTEGAFNLTARGTAETGGIINAALDPIIDELYRTNPAGERRTRDQLAYDALVELARRSTSADASGPKRPNERFLALLRVDAEALRRGETEGEERCEIAGVGPVPVRVARALLGDSVLKLVITRGVDVAHVTSLGRGPTAAMKVAIAWSMATCSVEGCSRTHVEYDHRLEYRTTRHTRLDELDPLCDGHHDLKTRRGWALVPGRGKRPFVPPDDPRHPAHGNRPPPPAPGAPVDRGAVQRQRRSLVERVLDAYQPARGRAPAPLPGSP